MLTDNDRDWLASVLSDKRRRSPLRVILRSINWEIFLGFLIVLGFLGWVLWSADLGKNLPVVFAFVVVGWIFSLCLHEFAHAAVAFLGGDNSDSTISYLSFNPIRYINPVMSIILPVVFILLGGIALPGGAVYVHRERIRGRWKQCFVSLAGPLMNGLCALVLAVPFLVIPNFEFDHPALAAAMAGLAFFEVFALLVNLIPLPPLDGFGAISPWLSAETQVNATAYGFIVLIGLFIVLWEVPAAGAFLDNIISAILGLGHIDELFWQLGLAALTFWRQ